MASLLELVEALVRDPAAKAAYRADPDDFLDRHGFGGLEPADLEEALHHAADSFPPTLAAYVDPASGFDSLVHVDLQELGFDDELRPLDPLDDDVPDLTDWNGPSLGDDVDFDAPPGAGADGEGPDGDGSDGDGSDDGSGDGPDGAAAHDPAFDRLDVRIEPAAAQDADAEDAGDPVDGDRLGVDGLDAVDGGEVDAAEGEGVDADGPRADALGLDALVDQPATADWADDGFDRPGLGPDSDDPWFYNQEEPTFEVPDDVDDDILDDVDDFHHDG